MGILFPEQLKKELEVISLCVGEIFRIGHFE
jgi:hypothetical protein